MNFNKLHNAVEHAYEKRHELIVIGLTGRTGAGCTTVSKILEKEFYDKLDVRELQEHTYENTDIRKQFIINNYMKQGNWAPFIVIDVSSIILYKAFQKCDDCETLIQYIKKLCIENKILTRNVNDIEKDVQDLKSILDKSKSIHLTLADDKDTCEKNKLSYDSLIENLQSVKAIKTSFQNVCNRHNIALPKGEGKESEQYTLYTYLMQQFGNNLRKTGNALDGTDFQQNKNTTIVEFITNIIEAIYEFRKSSNQFPNGNLRICIDAIRNPYEAIYLRDTFKYFYLFSINTSEQERAKRLRYLNKAQLDKLDEIEGLKDKKKNEEEFYHQNVQACIELADIHLHNATTKNGKYYELTSELLRYIALMLHPGLVTPTAIERCMQVAYTAKLNSGCLSRQVGAVVARPDYSVQAVGWNDVPKGQVSCNLRDVHGYCKNKDCGMYSKYEIEDNAFNKAMNYLNEALTESEEKTVNQDNNKQETFLPYCFKDVYNGMKKEKNQVYTRALHAEENAFLQISKYGGEPLLGGYLFTTASPCELCSKKAYQLGIKKIYYIDPYPGISQDHILTFGKDTTNNPEMILFHGAIGEAYVDLYRQRIPVKDELEMRTGFKVKNAVTAEQYSDGLKYGDLKYLDSQLEIHFHTRTEIEIIQTVVVKVLKPEGVDKIVRTLDYTESSFISGLLNEELTDGNITLKALTTTRPYVYELSLGQKYEAGQEFKFSIHVKVRDDKYTMVPELGQKILFDTDKLLIKLVIPKNIVKEVSESIYADEKKKMRIKSCKCNETVAYEDKKYTIYSFESQNVLPNYTYFLEWKFKDSNFDEK